MASASDTNVDSFGLIFDKSELAFNDAVVISGIDARQLRNGLDRGALRVGTKLRVGRWAFTLRDCLQLLVIARLTSRTWMPISVAAEAAARIAVHAERHLDEIRKLTVALDDQESAEGEISEFIIYQARDGLEVVLHRRGGPRWGFYRLDGVKIELSSWLAPHIRMSVLGLMSTLLQSYAVAMGEGLPPGVAEAIEQENTIDSVASGGDGEAESSLA